MRHASRYIPHGEGERIILQFDFTLLRAVKGLGARVVYIFQAVVNQAGRIGAARDFKNAAA
jgi:hypothetical protein